MLIELKKVNDDFYTEEYENPFLNILGCNLLEIECWPFAFYFIKKGNVVKLLPRGNYHLAGALNHVNYDKFPVYNVKLDNLLEEYNKIIDYLKQ